MRHYLDTSTIQKKIMPWFVDWVLRAIQDFLKSDLSFNSISKALIFVFLVGFLGFILKRREIKEWANAKYNRITNKDQIKEVEDAIKSLRLRIYENLLEITDKDEEFQHQLKFVIREIDELCYQQGIDQSVEENLSIEVEKLGRCYEDALGDLKRLVNDIQDEIGEAERIFSDASSARWTKKRKKEIDALFKPSDSTESHYQRNKN